MGIEETRRVGDRRWERRRETSTVSTRSLFFDLAMIAKCEDLGSCRRHFTRFSKTHPWKYNQMVTLKIRSNENGNLRFLFLLFVLYSGVPQMYSK